MGLLDSFYPVKKSTPPISIKTEMPTITMADLLNLPSNAPPPGFEPPPKLSRPPAGKGAVIGGARLESDVRQTARMVTWSARDAKKKPVWVHILRDGAFGAEIDAFVENATRLTKLTREDGVTGLLGVLHFAEDQRAFVSARHEIGSARDLKALGWELDRIAEFFGAFVTTLEELHTRGIFVGCLSPDDVLVSDDFEPVLAWTGTGTSEAVRVGADDVALVAPELKSGLAPDGLTDVFVAGRILEALTSDWIAHAGNRAASVKKLLAKATHDDSAKRHESVRALFEDLERVVKALEEAKPGPATAAADGAAPPRPAAKPREAARPAPRKPLPSFTAVTEEFGEVAVARPAWIVAGVAGLVAVCLVAFFVPVSTNLTRVLEGVGAISAAFGAAGAPVAATRARLGRGAYGLAAIVAVLVFSPISLAAAKGRDRRLHSSNDAARSVELQRELARKHPNFTGVDLHGYDLSGRNLAEVSFEDANLFGANLRGANLTGAAFGGANLEGAALEGANLEVVSFATTKGVELASCDDSTVLPNGFACVEGHVKRSNANAPAFVP